MLHLLRRRTNITTSVVCLSSIASTTQRQAQKAQESKKNDDEEEEDKRKDNQTPTAIADATTERTLAKKISSILTGHSLPWTAQVVTFLAELEPAITRTVVFHSLDLIKPPSTALQFFLWLRRRRRIQLDDRIHFKMLQVLCRCRDLSTANEFLVSLHTDPTDDSLIVLHDRFINEIIRAHSRQGQLRQSIELFQRMEVDFGVPPSVFSYNSLISALFARGRTEAAKKLFDRMTKRVFEGREGNVGVGVKPDVCTFNTMIRGFCLNGRLADGFWWFSKMEKWRCEPDLCTYNTLLDGLCRAGKIDVARNFLNGMKKKKSNQVNPNLVSYTTLIRGYCCKSRVADAMEIFREMVAEGIEPNSITFNTIIHGLCQMGEMEQVKEIMEYITAGGLKPNVCTLNTLITAYCNKGDAGKAMEVFSSMPVLKLKPDSATYSLLIRLLCQTKDYERAEMLLSDLLDKGILDKKRGSKHLMAAYNPIFEYLCQKGKVKKAGELFKQLLKNSTVDVSSFKVLILGHCREGEFREGYGILTTMLNRELVPDEETYKALIDGFTIKVEIEYAWKTFKKMLNSGHRPGTAMFHSMLKWLVENNRYAVGAGELVILMLERKIMQDIDLSTRTVIALYKDGLHGRAFEIVHMLYNNGYRVEMERVVSSLFDDEKFLETRNLLLFSVEKHRNLTSDAYVAGIRGLCQIGKATDGFKLFYELIEVGRGDVVSSDCLQELEVGLEKEGQLREAEFVSKRKNRSSSTNIENHKKSR